MRWRLLAIALAFYPCSRAFAAGISPSFLGPSPQVLVPSPFVTRAEAVYRLVESDQRLRERAAEYRSHMPPLPLFHDVPQWDALAPFLEVAFEEGIISGNRERLFHPLDALRTEEAQSMMRKLRGGGEPEQGGGVIFFVQPIPRENFLALLHGGPVLGASSVASVPSVSSFAPPSPLYPPDLFAITLPSLGIDRLTVTHPKDPTTHAGIIEPLKRGVGHLFGFPGEGGKVMIYGHSSGYPWDVSAYTRIFRGVNRLAVGDPVAIAYQGQRFTYQVTAQQRIEAGDLRPFQEDFGGEELILYTCWPPDSTSERLLVRAKPVDTLPL